MQKQELKPEIVAIQHLADEYPNMVQCYEKVARHIEGTDQCMITLPCKNKDKRLLIVAIDLE